LRFQTTKILRPIANGDFQRLDFALEERFETYLSVVGGVIICDHGRHLFFSDEGDVKR